LATYWAEKNFRCNALFPGGVFNHQNEAFLNEVTSRIPLGRMAHVDDFKSAIVFMATDASSYLNGAVLCVDGGWAAWVINIEVSSGNTDHSYFSGVVKEDESIKTLEYQMRIRIQIYSRSF
jgi:hypothetical protein